MSSARLTFRQLASYKRHVIVRSSYSHSTGRSTLPRGRLRTPMGPMSTNVTGGMLRPLIAAGGGLSFNGLSPHHGSGVMYQSGHGSVYHTYMA